MGASADRFTTYVWSQKAFSGRERGCAGEQRLKMAEKDLTINVNTSACCTKKNESGLLWMKREAWISGSEWTDEWQETSVTLSKSVDLQVRFCVTFAVASISGPLRWLARCRSETVSAAVNMVVSHAFATAPLAPVPFEQKPSSVKPRVPVNRSPAPAFWAQTGLAGRPERLAAPGPEETHVTLPKKRSNIN